MNSSKDSLKKLLKHSLFLNFLNFRRSKATPRSRTYLIRRTYNRKALVLQHNLKVIRAWSVRTANFKHRIYHN